MRLILPLLFWTTLVCGQEVHFRYNILGYHPSDQKMVLLMSASPITDKVELIDSHTGQVILEAPPMAIKAGAWGQFDQQYLFDFTKVEQNGTYQIRYGEAYSEEVQINSEKYQGHQEDMLAFMRQQRCGYNPYFDVVCHQSDGRIFYAPVADSTYFDFSGGWHDAGDQLKYLITSSNATARMLLAYLEAPDLFGDQVDAYGHPANNGVPDILDEAKWGLDWILKLHPKPDWLIHQIADDRDHRGFKYPHKDNAAYGWGPNSYRVAYFANGQPQGLGKWKSQATGIANLAGRCAAAFALGARIWANTGLDSLFAARCRKAAIELYQLGKAKEGFQQGNSFGAPYRYNENTWADDMEWGAAELFKLTGEDHYLKDAIHYAYLIQDDGWMARDTMMHYELYPFMNMGQLRSV